MSRELDMRIQALLFPWNESNGRCRVCGWPLGTERGQCRPGDCSLRPPPSIRADEPARFSIDLNYAMAAYLAFKTGNVTLQVGDTVLSPEKQWYAELDFGKYRSSITRYAPTPAEAICEVILAAGEAK